MRTSRWVKVSVRMPSGLVAVADAQASKTGVDHYVAEALERKYRRDLLGELIDELCAEFGLPSEDLVLASAQEWPDYRSSRQ
jgi:hypothetical protein